MSGKINYRRILFCFTFFFTSYALNLLAIDKIKSNTGESSPESLTQILSVEASDAKSLASKLLRLKKYDEIDQVIRHFISTKSRNSKGESDLLNFFRGLSNVGSKSSLEAFKQSESRLDEWIENGTNSSYAKTAKALMLNSYAWKARGGGFASNVSNEAWKHFIQRSRQSQDLVLDANDSSNPIWFYAFQQLATGLNMPKDQYYTLVSLGTTLHPEFDEIHKNAVWYLLPRWHGVTGDWQAYRDEIVSNTRDNLRKKELYFFISSSAIRFEPPNQFQELDVNWEMFRQGAEVRDARFPSKSLQAYLCLIACLMKDKDSARRYFLRESETGPYQNSRWERNTFRSVDFWRDWAFEGGTWSMAIDELLDLAKKGDPIAQYEVGTALFFRNQKKNLKESEKWLKKALEKNHDLASTRLVSIRHSTENLFTPTIEAWDIASGNMNLVKNKLEAGADPNVLVYPHVTALHWACEKGQLEIALMLLSREAMPNPLNGARLTPLDLVKGPNRNGIVPLERMSEVTQKNLIELLEKNGAKSSKEIVKQNSNAKKKE